MSGIAPSGDGTVAVAPVPKVPRHAQTAELRLALVCYGGVSLAIYMHGVTKEIQKLVAASRAYERDPETCAFNPSETEHAYWHALKKREDEKGIRTRVVVDVISGTSAGGINGIILAKALAHDLPQDGLRKVWIERGDIKKLMAKPARKFPTLPLKLLAWAVKSRLSRATPPLDGDRMFKWIHEALGSMDAKDQGNTLMPELHPLELFVTVTDFHGYNRRVPTYDPKRVSDLRHRHAMVFARSPGRDQFDEAHNPELTFSARATSSFPGAFPPINLANVKKNLPDWNGLESFKEEFWGIYALSNEPVEKTHFVDGGVLDNFPFRHSIDAIRRRPAALEVDRRLVFIEPDPKGLAEPASGDPPGWLETIWGGLAGIRGHEPVLDDLLAVREMNDRIDRIREIVDAGVETISAPGVTDRGQSYDEAAVTNASFAYTTYIQLKLYAVVTRFAERACDICRFPPDSNHAFFVKDVLVAWARDRGILASSVEPSDLQKEFLKDFDLDYAERRIRFAINYVNKLYGGAGRPGRAELNDAKRQLYSHIGMLNAAAAGAGAGPSGDAVRALFKKDVIQGYVDSDDPPDVSVAAFLEDHGDEVDAAQVLLRGHLDQALGNFAQTVAASVREMSEEWDEPARGDLRDRYERFPLWDVLIFPLQAVADVGELNRVEVVRFSPEDVGMLSVENQAGERPTAKEKLQGVRLGHFAAFFKRSRRENDYLWGRLDAAERLVTLVLGAGDPDISRPAFKAILDEESKTLNEVRPLIEYLRGQLAQ